MTRKATNEKSKGRTEDRNLQRKDATVVERRRKTDNAKIGRKEPDGFSNQVDNRPKRRGRPPKSATVTAPAKAARPAYLAPAEERITLQQWGIALGIMLLGTYLIVIMAKAITS